MAGDVGDPGQQFAAAWQAATAAVGAWQKQVAAATNEALTKLDPALRAAVEAGRSAFSGDWRNCRCQCGTAHPDDAGVCDGRPAVRAVCGGSGRRGNASLGKA